MTKPFVSGLVIAAVLVAQSACTSTDEDTIDHESGRFHVQWSVAENGAASTCAAYHADLIEIVVSPVLGGTPDLDRRYPCTDGSAMLDALPPGEYYVNGSVLDEEG